MTTTLIDPATMPGVATHYGIPVAILGDDGDTWIAFGDIEPRRAIAAWNRMCRVDLGYRWALEDPDVHVDQVQHETWVVAATCGECRDDPECRECAEIRRNDWWLRPALNGEPHAFPVAVMSF